MKDVIYDLEACDCYCDVCQYNHMVYSTDYRDINNELRSNWGWIIKCIDGEWLDFCGQECYSNFLKKK